MAKQYIVLAATGTYWLDQTPAPGHTYTRATWPPRGRGRGESLTSPRRLEAKQRAGEAMRMRSAGATWATIAAQLGYKSRSGPLNAVKRTIASFDEDERRKRKRARDRILYS